MKNIKEITDIFKQEIKKKYTAQITMPVYMGVSDMEIILEEIERLNKENEELKKIQCTFLGTGCKAEIERLHSIIKEVREYIKENNNKEPWKSLNGKELLEILDKVD